MRKYVFIALSILLLLSFTALTYAEEPQIKLGGKIMVRGWLFSNALFSNSVPGVTGVTLTNTVAVPGNSATLEASSSALWTSNISLTVDAKVADNVQGFLEFEVAQGENAQSGLYIWGGNTHPFQNYDAKPNADFRLRQAWIQYTGSGLLGAPAGLKVGHQLLTLGEKQFLNHERFGDDALLLFVEPTKDLFLAAVIAKINEGAYIVQGDDIDAYVLLGTYKVNKDTTVGMYYFFANCNDLDNPENLQGAFAGVSGRPYLNRDALSLQDLGLHANGLLAGIINYAVEIDTQFGKVKAQPGSGLGDEKYRGYAIYMKGAYKIPDTALNLRASFALGSGDDDGVSTGTDNKIKEFQTSQGFDTETALARFVHYTQIYERTIATAALVQTVGGNGRIAAAIAGQLQAPHRNTGIANTTYYNLGVDLAASKDLTLSLDGYILRATESEGWENSLLVSDVSKNVGWELDFKGSYKLAKNLTYFVEAGSFKPGKFYEDTLMVETKRTVTQFIHGLNLTF